MNRDIRLTLCDYKNEEFPKEYLYNEGMEHPQFKITIEKQESDCFIDSTGQKWKKVKS